MLPDVGGLELLVIAAVALIVVGPKDLPLMLRKLGQFTARLRGMGCSSRDGSNTLMRCPSRDRRQASKRPSRPAPAMPM